jgi:hypothetical protein
MSSDNIHMVTLNKIIIVRNSWKYTFGASNFHEFHGEGMLPNLYKKIAILHLNTSPQIDARSL